MQSASSGVTAHGRRLPPSRAHGHGQQLRRLGVGWSGCFGWTSLGAKMGRGGGPGGEKERIDGL
ncbi:hypothetical protein E2562_017004 [Oryza meyeriana var. granulata]|uniref:Uncharacterized protein n=1 Tax=Oryza meyeriana var. granulata TaxID=110450 RepID=A0A6G1EBA7_9ORYZ|nr:hypothetical protein E2562_017004 [Oryza meyeriana var. granulata]